MSRKSDINLSLGIDIIQKGFDEAVKSSHGAGKKLEGEAKKQTAIIQAQMDRIGKAKTLKQANRQMENLLGTMSQFDVFASLPHSRFPGGKWLAQPLATLGLLYYAMRDRL